MASSLTIAILLQGDLIVAFDLHLPNVAFPAETLQNRKEWNDILKVQRKKMPTQNTLSRKSALQKCVCVQTSFAPRHTLPEMLKGVQVEMKGL